MASTASVNSAKPVMSRRTVRGWFWRTHSRSSTPLRPGRRWSVRIKSMGRAGEALLGGFGGGGREHLVLRRQEGGQGAQDVWLVVHHQERTARGVHRGDLLVIMGAAPGTAGSRSPSPGTGRG